MSTQSRHILDEIVLHIIESIPSRQDLLTFGLTSSKHLSIVKPHLAHRVIRCYLDNKALWLYFIQHPEYAAYVSKLEILGSYTRSGDLERVPSPLLSNSALHQSPSFETHSDALEEAERLLIQALRFMVNLESFDWQHTIPLITSGNPDSGECSQSGDVWTNLRDFTQIKNLSTPTLYTLRNLTHIKMKVYYSEPNDGDTNSDDSEGENNGETRPLRAPRVDISRLKPFLLGCSGLQVLDISIIDRPFYFSPKRGNPFTDLTSIFADTHWPLLHTIEMWDITSDPDVILSFFLRHPSLSTVQFGLSIAAEDLPENPFVFPPALDKGGELKGLTTSFLANASSISLPSATIHSMIPYISYPWPVKDLGTVVPFDWCSLPPRSPIVVPDLDRAYEEERFVDRPSNLPTKCEDGQGLVGECDEILKLDKMPNLRSITIRELTDFSQLDQLTELTPHLESLYMEGCGIMKVHRHPAPHTLWLPYLCKWPNLERFSGTYLWIPSTTDDSISHDHIREVAEACPNLRYVPSNKELGGKSNWDASFFKLLAYIIIVAQRQGPFFALTSKNSEFCAELT
ncbi:hypothetical protein ONZ45_g6054 [Pleurotus djamor]|nr:hypothetical protein ONZ45_g6054 [Pleurotus djamor]